ncbi:NDP-hexose 2,3-dehydratase [Streptomyces armeniacus]|uniref:NDP-hexose 2,3-dehydratase n=1 Tax=Streptomyces armeniacus TaxID=83291 RepID=A0A345XYB9_9ACTN|nr:NDP-hexose 2,3-dehydratase family protein [Streptomyces armeniacus]AXK36635.1 NDP-hexose 2,3-dehydratase [Streptomyces armeniacus]QIQ28613.1 Nbc17 [Streptomyces sp.]
MHKASAALTSRGSGTGSGTGGEPAARLAVSAAATDGVAMSNAAFFEWFDERRREQPQQVRRIPFSELSGWGFDQATGNLQHRSGRFFTVHGLRVRSDFGPVPEWEQPIINQPEFGILGIAVREIDGVLHLLMQAKSEPGNINGVQLSPTIQATKSNYSRVHGGSAVKYLESFHRPAPGSVLADSLQSEQGTWFYRKRNRNMVVEVGPEVEAGEDFCWLTLGQVNALLGFDNLVNMDARTVLSCLPDWQPAVTGEVSDGAPATSLHSAMSLHSDTEVRSWLTQRRIEHEIITTALPLNDVTGWERWDDRIEHERGRYFSIIAVDVSSGRREVPAWSQPLLHPSGVGLAGLLVRHIDGVLHALMRARVEPGLLDIAELAPTVQGTPGNYAHLPAEDRPPFQEELLERSTEQALFDSVLSEEGGRFHHAECRYVITEVADDVLETEDGLRPGHEEFRWMSVTQLGELLKYSSQLNVQARTLVAALRSVR